MLVTWSALPLPSGTAPSWAVQHWASAHWSCRRSGGGGARVGQRDGFRRWQGGRDGGVASGEWQIGVTYLSQYLLSQHCEGAVSLQAVHQTGQLTQHILHSDVGGVARHWVGGARDWTRAGQSGNGFVLNQTSHYTRTHIHTHTHKHEHTYMLHHIDWPIRGLNFLWMTSTSLW